MTKLLNKQAEILRCSTTPACYNNNDIIIVIIIIIITTIETKKIACILIQGVIPAEKNVTQNETERGENT